MALSILLVAVAQATVVPRVTLEELVENSDLIVQAHCARSWAAWDENTRVIWTHAELLLTEGVKGPAGRSVVVSEPGGVVGEVGMTVEGVPHYRPGEEVVVFLYRAPNGLLRTRGLGQGKFTVVAGSATTERLVRTNSGGMALVSPPGAERSRGIKQEDLDRLKLDEFLGLVRSLASRQSRGGR